MDCRDDVLFLGAGYFSLLRVATRRDLAEAQEFFGVSMGQAGYVIGNLVASQLESVAGYGLPYSISNLSTLLSAGASARLGDSFQANKLTDVTGWRRQALEHAENHWWITRDWAKRDLGVAALLCGLRSYSEAVELSRIRSRDIKALAAESYNRMTMDASLGMQSALLLSDAEAAPDRVTVARCSSALLAA